MRRAVRVWGLSAQRMAGSEATGNRRSRPMPNRGWGCGNAEIHDYPSYLDWFSGAGGTAGGGGSAGAGGFDCPALRCARSAGPAAPGSEILFALGRWFRDGLPAVAVSILFFSLSPTPKTAPPGLLSDKASSLKSHQRTFGGNTSLWKCPWQPMADFLLLTLAYALPRF